MRFTLLAAVCGAAFSSTLLAETEYNLDEVVVTATRNPVPASEIASDVTVLTRSVIQDSGATSLPELLATQPEIELVSQGGLGSQSSLFIRGSNPGHTLILIDGMRVGSATAGTTPLEHIPLLQIDRIEILRGPASSLYGADAIGGVVQIFTRHAKNHTGPNLSIGLGSYGTARASAGYDISTDRLHLRFDAGTQYSDGIDATTPANTYHNPDRDGYRNRNAGLRLDYNLTAGHTLAFNTLFSDSRTAFDNGPGDSWQKERLSSYAISSQNRFATDWISTLRFGVSRDHYENLSWSTMYDTEQRQYQWQNDLDLGTGTLILGIERNEQRVESSTAYTNTARDINSILAGYRIGQGIRDLQVNLRRDQSSQFGSHITGSMAYGYRFSPTLRATAGLGTAFKTPNFNDLYYPYESYGVYGSYVGNPGLKPEKASNGEFGLHYEAGGLEVSAIVFHNDIQDLIAYYSDAANNGTMVNVNNALIDGLSLAGSTKLGSWRLAAHLDYQNPRDAETDNLLPRRARIHGGMSAKQKFGNIGFTAEMLASGRRYDDLANTKPLSAYALFNLGADWQVTKETRINARFNNVFDKHYELAAGYNTAGSNLFVGLNYQPR
jgi:vitamin B12 transporter